MNNLAQIIQLIATAVNSKLTYKLSQQIAAISLVTQKGPGWIDRTAAGRALSQRRIQASESRMKDSIQEHGLARTQAQQSAAEWLQESLVPTGRDLAALADTAEKYRLKMEAAAKELDRVTKEHYAIKAAEVSERQVRRTEKSDEAVRLATVDRDAIQNQYSSVRQAVTDEMTNPTGMDPAILSHLEGAAAEYERQLLVANESLVQVTREQDQLRRAIDMQIDALEGMTPEESTKLDRSGTKVEVATDTRNRSQRKFNQSQEELSREILTPSGKTPEQLMKMAEAVDRYKLELDNATATLKRVSESEQRTQESLVMRARNQKIAQDRQPQSKFGQALRRIRTRVRRMIGSRGRKEIQGYEKRFDRVQKNIQAIRDPERAQKQARELRAKADAAQQRYQESVSQHATNVEEHKQTPTPKTKSAMEESGKVAASAGEEAEAAEGMAVMAEEAAGLAAALGPVGVAIGVAAAAAVAAATLIGAAIKLINNKVAEGQREVERFRHERARFSSQVAGAIARFDLQTIQLEQRSTRATSQSATGVVDATARLRESNQPRSEIWENIANGILEQTIVLTTFVSDLINAIDPISQNALFLVEKSKEALKLLGFRLSSIDENTRKAGDNVGLDVVKKFNLDNKNARGNKAFPELKPIK